jgi:hypothetical protein
MSQRARKRSRKGRIDFGDYKNEVLVYDPDRGINRNYLLGREPSSVTASTTQPRKRQQPGTGRQASSDDAADKVCGRGVACGLLA